MGEFASRGWLKVLSGLCAVIVIGLNGYLIAITIGELGREWAQSGSNPWWVYGTIGSVAALLALFLGWLMVLPLWKRRPVIPAPLPEPVLQAIHYQRIGVAVEFAGTDDHVLQQATALAQAHRAELIIIHVVDGAGASLLGSEADDQESRHDRQYMVRLVEFLGGKGLTAQGVLGYGVPAEELIRIAEQKKLDLLVLGSHGHRFLADMALGSTVDPVLHRLTIPVLVVPGGRGRP
jgi:manganese transport protein